MSSAWGVVIPGLAMNSSEIPKLNGLIALQNPEIGDGVKLDNPYSLFDVAEIHLNKIQELLKSRALDTPLVWVIGMSMGGMINSILASEFRSKLPTHVKFGFLVTSPNLKSNPAIPDSLLEEWKTATPGIILDFERILKPFFSSKFLNTQNHVAKTYYHYRAMGLNQQSPKAFFRQMQALRSFDGENTFSRINTDECKIIGGDDDRILGPSHNFDLKTLAAGATHLEINNLGHMVNYERPDLFDFRQAIYV